MRVMPSLLSADFANLQQSIEAIPSADALHVDVMDYHFVPNLTLGLPVVHAIRKVTRAFLDIHLMIDNPDRWAPSYAEAGANSVTFHAEAAHAPIRLARELRKHGARAGMALKPATPIEPYADLLPELDLVLIMTVEPGFGGQKFLDVCLPKIERTRKLLDGQESDIWLQVDGGISAETIERCAAAGADSFVAGSAVFHADHPDEMVKHLRSTRRRFLGLGARWALGDGVRATIRPRKLGLPPDPPRPHTIPPSPTSVPRPRSDLARVGNQTSESRATSGHHYWPFPSDRAERALRRRCHLWYVRKIGRVWVVVRRPWLGLAGGRACEAGW